MAPSTFFLIVALSFTLGLLCGLFAIAIFSVVKRVYHRYLTRGRLQEVVIPNRADFAFDYAQLTGDKRSRQGDQ